MGTVNVEYVRFLLHNFLINAEFFPELVDEFYRDMVANLGSEKAYTCTPELKRTNSCTPTHNVDVDCCFNSTITSNKCNIV